MRLELFPLLIIISININTIIKHLHPHRLIARLEELQPLAQAQQALDTSQQQQQYQPHTTREEATVELYQTSLVKWQHLSWQSSTHQLEVVAIQVLLGSSSSSCSSSNRCSQDYHLHHHLQRREHHLVKRSITIMTQIMEQQQLVTMKDSTSKDISLSALQLAEDI